MLNGGCGGRAPGWLPVDVGDAFDVCPTALALSSQEALRLSELVPSRIGPGLLDGMAASALPPRYRAALRHARLWLSDFHAAQRAEQQDTGGGA